MVVVLTTARAMTMAIFIPKYSDIQTIRSLLLKEIQLTFNNTPLNSEHYCLVEYRLQNLIQSGVNLEDLVSGADPIVFVEQP